MSQKKTNKSHEKQNGKVFGWLFDSTIHNIFCKQWWLIMHENIEVLYTFNSRVGFLMPTTRNSQWKPIEKIDSTFVFH